MHPPNGAVTTDTLQAFTDAWNGHDIDALMSFMTDDCVFQAAGGPLACGARHEGRDAVRAAFAAAWQNFPDAQWRNGRHFVDGDRGVSEWTFIGTKADGTRIEADGCDLFTFRDGRIAVKNAFRKDRPPVEAARARAPGRPKPVLSLVEGPGSIPSGDRLRYSADEGSS